VRLLRQTVRGALNLEMAATDEMVAIARDVKPDVVTLVPEKREERTTEGGLDLERHATPIGHAATALREVGIPVSLFIDPDDAVIRQARSIGVPRIELHTGDYCERFHPIDHFPGAAEVVRLRRAAKLASSLGLHVAAGHGLD